MAAASAPTPTDTKDSKDEEFVYGTLPSDREDEAAKLLAITFVSSPGMEQSMGITNPDAMLGFTTLTVKHSQKHKWTLIAYHRATNDIAAILTGEDFAMPPDWSEAPESPEHPSMSVVGEFMEDLDEPFRAKYEVKPGDICHIVLVATVEKYQRRGLAARLCALSMEAARSRGYKAIVVECVHDGMKHVWCNHLHATLFHSLKPLTWSPKHPPSSDAKATDNTPHTSATGDTLTSSANRPVFYLADAKMSVDFVYLLLGTVSLVERSKPK